MAICYLKSTLFCIGPIPFISPSSFGMQFFYSVVLSLSILFHFFVQITSVQERKPPLAMQIIAAWRSTACLVVVIVISILLILFTPGCTLTSTNPKCDSILLDWSLSVVPWLWLLTSAFLLWAFVFQIIEHLCGRFKNS